MKNADWEGESGYSQRLMTMKRNYKHAMMPGSIHEDLLPHVKLRLLEDELMAERMKV
jgi:hypothetical protein